MHDVLIVGGGLCGLVAFRQLKHLDVLLLEARPRCLALLGLSTLFERRTLGKVRCPNPTVMIYHG